MDQTANLRADPALALLRRKLNAIYGSRLDSVVLFGSRAWGGARPDSDYDVAVFLRGLHDPRLEADRMADIGWEILRDLGLVVSAKAFPAEDRQRETLILETIRNEGVPV
jgi:predicted nucleotidyltransferase